MDIKALLPKNKFDELRIDKLESLSDEIIQPIIPDLLKWLKDYNWPVAKQVLPILLSRESLVFPYLSDILNGDDLIWSYWILELLIPLNCEHKNYLRPEIEKLASLSGQDADIREIVEQAQRCLLNCYGL